MPRVAAWTLKCRKKSCRYVFAERDALLTSWALIHVHSLSRYNIKASQRSALPERCVLAFVKGDTWKHGNTMQGKRWRQIQTARNLSEHLGPQTSNSTKTCTIPIVSRKRKVAAGAWCGSKCCWSNMVAHSTVFREVKLEDNSNCIRAVCRYILILHHKLTCFLLYFVCFRSHEPENESGRFFTILYPWCRPSVFRRRHGKSTRPLYFRVTYI